MYLFIRKSVLILKWHNIIDFNTKLYIYIYIDIVDIYLFFFYLSFFSEQLNYLRDKRIKYNFPQLVIIAFEKLCFTFWKKILHATFHNP